MRLKKKFLFTLLGCAPQLLLAAGFEKANFWSAESAGRSGAVASITEGADALFYNPAGLAKNAKNDSAEASLNYSPTYSKFSGPVRQSNDIITSNNELSNPVGALAQYRFLEGWGAGIGFYVIGGAKGNYGDVDYSPVSSVVTYRPTVKTDIQLSELSLGVGNQVNKNFSWGAGLRIDYVKGDFDTATIVSNQILLGTKYDGLKDNAFGFRLGGKYLSDDETWGLGLTYRSQVDFSAKGTSSGSYQTLSASSTGALTGGGSITAKTSLPQSIEFGGHFKPMDNFTLFAQYQWNNYSHNKQIEFSGDALSISGTNLVGNLNLNWKDESVFKFAAEYMFESNTKIRGGYIYSTPVTDKNYAFTTLAPPSSGNTFAFGVGQDLMDKKVTLDGTYEYITGKGDGNTEGTTTVTAKSGTFKATLSAFYLSARIRF